MCDVCRLENAKRLPLKGHKAKTFKRHFYTVFTDRKATVSLCYLHDIELFMTGENEFLKRHLKLAKDLVENKAHYLESL